MLSVSDEFRKAVSENPNVLVKGRVDFPSGETLDLAPGDFIGEGAVFTHATSSAGSFDIGAVISGTVDVTLRNDDGRLDEYDFSKATITMWVGKELSTGVEWLRKGKYWIDQPDSYGDVFGFTALDATSLLDRPFSIVKNLVFPATLGDMVFSTCSKCRVGLATETFPNDGITVPSRPDDEALTCRDVLSYAAQASGNFVRARQSDDALEIGWYDTAVFEGEAWLDGGYFDAFDPYLSGDAADGGSFDDYSAGHVADGGDFAPSRVPIISALASMTVCTDDVLVTGVTVDACDGPSGADGGVVEGESARFGKGAYALAIDSNPLIQPGMAEAVAAAVGGRVVNMRFRPFEASAVGAPYLEPGDAVVLYDRNQRYFATFLTRVTYKTGGYASLACSAETPARRTAQRFSAQTQAIVANKNLVTLERDERKRAIAGLERIVGEGSGLYQTVETKPDGSKVYYMHDKPTLGESKIVWRMSADALAVSTDGGKTYASGLTAAGDALLNRIYAIGLDANRITTGTLDASKVTIDNLARVGDDSNHVLIDGRNSSIKMAVNGIDDALVIKATETTRRTESFFHEDGSYLVSSKSGGSYRCITSHDFAAEMVNGEPHMRFGMWVDVYSGSNYSVSRYEKRNILVPIGDVTQIARAFKLGPVEITVHVNDIPGGNRVGMVFKLSVDSGDYGVTAFGATYPVDEPGGEIGTKSGEHFLTDFNIGQYLGDGKGYTGHISIPFAFNNIQRNYNFDFVNGVLVNHQLLTPTSPNFRV